MSNPEQQLIGESGFPKIVQKSSWGKLSGLIRVDGLSGNNPSAEVQRPILGTQLRKAGANIAELRKILHFPTSDAGDTLCTADCLVRNQSVCEPF